MLNIWSDHRKPQNGQTETLSMSSDEITTITETIAQQSGIHASNSEGPAERMMCTKVRISFCAIKTNVSRTQQSVTELMEVNFDATGDEDIFWMEASGDVRVFRGSINKATKRHACAWQSPVEIESKVLC